VTVGQRAQGVVLGRRQRHGRVVNRSHAHGQAKKGDEMCIKGGKPRGDRRPRLTLGRGIVGGPRAVTWLLREEGGGKRCGTEWKKIIDHVIFNTPIRQPEVLHGCSVCIGDCRCPLVLQMKSSTTAHLKCGHDIDSDETTMAQASRENLNEHDFLRCTLSQMIILIST